MAPRAAGRLPARRGCVVTTLGRGCVCVRWKAGTVDAVDVDGEPCMQRSSPRKAAVGRRRRHALTTSDRTRGMQMLAARHRLLFTCCYWYKRKVVVGECTVVKFF